jgi:hypothetical protein
MLKLANFYCTGIRLRGPHPGPLPEGEGASFCYTGISLRGPHPGPLPEGEGAIRLIPPEASCSDEERCECFGFDELAGLVQVVVDDCGRVDPECVVDRSQKLARMDRV